jgi:hypothetical protein
VELHPAIGASAVGAGAMAVEARHGGVPNLKLVFVLARWSSHGGRRRSRVVSSSKDPAMAAGSRTLLDRSDHGYRIPRLRCSARSRWVGA